MMRHTFTKILTCIGIALCIVHFFGHEYDPVYILFYALSVPAWIWPFFEYTDVNYLMLYLLTILTWALIGYIIDRFAYHGRRRGKA